MSENNMNGHDALTIAMQWLEYGYYQQGSYVAKQALDVFLKGSVKTEHESKNKKMRKCNICGALNAWNKRLCAGCKIDISTNHHIVRCNSKFTIHDEIRVIPNMSELELEEIK